MTKHEKLIEEVKDLISNAKTAKAIELLEQEQLSPLDKEIIILSSRYSQLIDEQRLGVLGDEEFQIKLNKINLGLLNVTEKIGIDPESPPATETPESELRSSIKAAIPEDRLEENEMQTEPKDPSKSEPVKSNSKKYFLIGGGILIIILAAVFGIMNTSKNTKIEKEKSAQKVLDDAAKKAERDAATKTANKLRQDSIERAKKIFLGNEFEGGIIFHIDNTGQQGLIMYQGDLTKKTIDWCDGKRPIPGTGAFGKKIFQGLSNTKKIVEKLGPGDYPAKICDDFVYENFDDWYLPSQQELDKLWEYTSIKSNNPSIIRHAGFSDAYYWSSTQTNKGVYYRSFFNKGAYEKVGSNKAHVRPIRKFQVLEQSN